MQDGAVGATTPVSRGLISDDIINQIRDRVDIADIVGQHVSMTKAGQNLKGCCPFHQDKTPSFTVSPSKQIFHCFGCGAGGNVFTFLIRITGANFPEVVRDLGRKVGIEIEEAAPHVGSQVAQARRVEQVNQAAAVWFKQNLLDERVGASGRLYLGRRGIQQLTIDQFGIGAAPAEWDSLLKALTKQGFSHSDLMAAGLVVARDSGSGFYDRFRGRVMFTINDLHKRVVGFGGRVLDNGTPKYLNSPDTPLFRKGHTLFALDKACEAIVRTKTVIVVEGYFDAIALHQAGISYVVATLGTALTPQHVQVLRRFAGNVVLLFDPDAAGVRAALRGLDLFVNSGLGVKVITLPTGDDPDTFVRKEGPDAFARLEAAAPSLLDYALDHSMKLAEAGSLESRVRSVDNVLRILQKSEHPIEREERMKIVAERLGINQSRLIERYPGLQSQPKKVPVSPGVQTSERTASTVFKGLPEERDLVLLLLHGRLAPADVRRLRPEAFTVAACRKLVELALTHLDRDGRIEVRPLLDEAVDDAVCGLLATELSLREDHFDDTCAHIKACLECLDRKRSEQVLRDLIGRLKTAEQEGRVDEVHLLNVQINEVRRRKAGTPTVDVGSMLKE